MPRLNRRARSIILGGSLGGIGLGAIAWPVGCIHLFGWGLMSLVAAVSGGYLLAFLAVLSTYKALDKS